MYKDVYSYPSKAKLICIETLTSFINMKAFIAFIALSVVCSVYSQTYGVSSYDPYDTYDGVGLLTGTRRHIGSRRLTGGSLLGRTRGLSLIGSRRLTDGSLLGRTRGLSRIGRGRVYRPSGSRYVDSGASYIPRRQVYPTTY